MSEPRPLWQRLALSATRIYLAVASILWLIQDVAIFPGVVLWASDTTHIRAPTGERFGIEDVWLDRDDGSRLLLWHHSAGEGRAVVFLHGNGEVAPHARSLILYLSEQGWDTVVMEFRGYGGVDGWPNESNLRADLDQTIAWVTDELHIDAARLVVHGRSIGGGVAGTAAGRHDVGGWVFESTFDSVAAMAQARFMVLPVDLLLRSRLDTASRVGGITAPILQMHSRSDEVVPFSRGEALAAAMPDQATFHAYDDLSHQTFLMLESKEAEAVYRDFLHGIAPDPQPTDRARSAQVGG